MMPRSALAAVAILVAIAVAPAAAKTDASFHYLNPKQLDFTVLLPPPPDLGSPQQRADEQARGASRFGTQARRLFDRAGEAPLRTVFFFAPSVGSDFTAERFPVTAAFFRRIGSDVEKLDRAGQDLLGAAAPQRRARSSRLVSERSRRLRRGGGDRSFASCCLPSAT